MSSYRISKSLAERYKLPVVVVHDIIVAALEEIEASTARAGRCEMRPLGVFKLDTRGRRLARIVFSHSSPRARALAQAVAQSRAAAAAAAAASREAPSVNALAE